jgi:hypothetical protein
MNIDGAVPDIELEHDGEITLFEGKPFSGVGVDRFSGRVFLTNYKDGKEDGPSTSWYENGQKYFEIHYKDGKRNGLDTKWYENGMKQSETHYKDGEPDGLHTAWYSNGRKRGEKHFKDGKEDGLWTEWDEDGEKTFEGNFFEGKEEKVSVSDLRQDEYQRGHEAIPENALITILRWLAIIPAFAVGIILGEFVFRFSTVYVQPELIYNLNHSYDLAGHWLQGPLYLLSKNLVAGVMGGGAFVWVSPDKYRNIVFNILFVLCVVTALISLGLIIGIIPYNLPLSLVRFSLESFPYLIGSLLGGFMAFKKIS